MSQITYSDDLPRDTLLRVSCNGLSREDATQQVSLQQERLEKDHIIIVDDLDLPHLEYFRELEIKRYKVLQGYLPTYHGHLKEEMDTDFENNIHLETKGLCLDTFFKNSEELVDILRQFVWKSFPTLNFTAQYGPTWRLYPVHMGVLHIDEFDMQSQTQSLRLLINLDRRARVVFFGEPIWKLAKQAHRQLDTHWPNDVAGCLKVFQKQFIQGMGFENQKLPSHTLVLEPGSFWIGHPTNIYHCGIAGKKAFVLDFEYDSASMKNPENATHLNWQRITGRPMT